jgi:hypothetical protein
MTVTLGNGKFDLHKQSVGKCMIFQLTEVYTCIQKNYDINQVINFYRFLYRLKTDKSYKADYVLIFR